MSKRVPTAEQRTEAVDRVLVGLARGEGLFQLATAVEPLHPRHDTFPGEVFLRLSGEALQLADVDADNPIAYEGLLDEHLAEHRFRGHEQRKIQFALLASAAARGGIEPDFLGEIIQWQTDDFSVYALAVAVVVIRACAERTGQSVSAFTERLAAHGVPT